MQLKRLKAKIAQLKTWQWFLLLYLAGFATIISVSYGIKLLMTGLP